MTQGRHRLRDGVRAGILGGIVGAAPSTAHALATGRDPLEASRAAGAILLPHARSTILLVATAVPVHLALSAGWGALLSGLLPRRHAAAWGGIAGAAIGWLDLWAGARKRPQVRALPTWPQMLDHVAYGATVGVILARHAECECKGLGAAKACADECKGLDAAKQRRRALCSQGFVLIAKMRHIAPDCASTRDGCDVD